MAAQIINVGNLASGTEPIPEFLTVQEVAHIFRMSEGAISRMARDGEIPALRIGSSWRIFASWVEKQLRAYKVEGGHAELAQTDLVEQGRHIARALAAAERAEAP